MKHRAGLSAALGLSFTTTLPACAPVVPAGAPQSPELSLDEARAAYAIAVARCDRQTASCDPFASRKACLDAKVALSAREARLFECGSPIDPARLARCVAVVRRGTCGTGIAHVDACSPNALCPDVAYEGTL